MDSAEWGLFGFGLFLMGCAVAILQAPSWHLTWLAIVLMVSGAVISTGSVVGYPLFVRFSRGVVAVGMPSASVLTHELAPPATLDVRQALRLLRTELQSMNASGERLQREGKFARPVTVFPAERWSEYSALLAREKPELYDLLEPAYVAADSLTQTMTLKSDLYSGRWLGLNPEDGLGAMIDDVREAIDALDDELR
jgi:hypothetical protein